MQISEVDICRYPPAYKIIYKNKFFVSEQQSNMICSIIFFGTSVPLTSDELVRVHKIYALKFSDDT